MVAEYKGTRGRAARNFIPVHDGQPTRHNPIIRPGMLVCTIKPENFHLYNWSNPRGIHEGIYNHPGVILNVRGNDVEFLVISSIDINFRYKDVRMQHLTISPTGPHPDTGEQLMLKKGRCHKAAYLKVHEVWILPKQILLKNLDKDGSGVQLELRPESFDYVRKAVAEFDQTPRSIQRLRPFRGFPGVVDHPADRYPSPPDTPSILYSPYPRPYDVPHPPRNKKQLHFQQMRPGPQRQHPRKKRSPPPQYGTPGPQRQQPHDQWSPPPLHTTPVPQGQQQWGGHEASFGKNGGSAYQNPMENRPGSPWNEEPVIQQAFKNDREQDVSRKTSRSHRPRA